MNAIVDLRSDTVTQPSAGMRRAMMDAPLGDDVFGDDPTVNRLQERAAQIFGFEAALFFPSGTQSNLAALISHCQRGEAVIIGAEQHSYRYEAGGLGVLGSIHPQVIPNRADGTLDLATVEATISPDDPHFPRTRLLALENTIGGKPIARSYLAEAVQLAKRRGLNVHLDGARIFNAAVHFKTSVRELCAGFDSVSSCLSKGLGTPAGTVLVGGKEFIGRAKRARKILGGAMRQAGVIAAAGLYALEHNVERLRIDHENAGRLARGLREPKLEVQQHTNMVMVRIAPGNAGELAVYLRGRGIHVLPGPPLRAVAHPHVDAPGIDRALAAFGAFISSCQAGRSR